VKDNPQKDYPSSEPGGGLDVTVVMPCLNEEAAIGECVERALEVLRQAGISGEVLVVDNASEDRSAEIAEACGARVVTEPRRGYGNAYLRGFREARGKYLIMLDADGTYPVEKIPDFLRVLVEERADLVIGNRFSGQMEKKAMPWPNRYIGNPVLSGLTRFLYRVWLKDIHCGMRGVRKSALEDLSLQMPGMEFATEMIVKALDRKLAVRQLDIPYRRRIGESKLRPLRDAWRHVEYMLVFSPAKFFLWPGMLLFGLGLLTQVVLLSGPQPFLFRTWDVHTGLAGLVLSFVGITLLILGMISCSLAWSVRMMFRHSALSRWVAQKGGRWSRIIGIIFFLLGVGTWLFIFINWSLRGFGKLSALPILTLATTLLTSGLSLVSASFVVHTLLPPR
jgi:glycosyltransferase involved in cell wall biosynthesis